MRKLLATVIVIGISICCKTNAQSITDSTNAITFYISASMGIKYHVTSINEWAYDEKEVYKHNNVFTAGISIDFWGGQKHLIGLELIGFPYIYGDHQSNPKNFTLIWNLFYRRSFAIYNNLSFCPAAGFTIFSNDPYHMFSPNIELGLYYKVGQFNLFIKNNFRYGIELFGVNTPSVFSIGLSLKL